MSRITSSVCVIAIVGAHLLGCDSATQIAQDLAASAPASAPPSVLNGQSMWAWAGNTDYFLGPSRSFEFDVDHGWLNKLALLENGSAVPEFDGNDPNNGAHTTQTMVETANDPNARTMRRHVKVFIPNGGFGDGRVLTYTLVETSINPAFKGTPQETASKVFTVVTPTPPQGITAYMERCFRSGVPLPPDWSETSAEWQLRGNLAPNDNLLQPVVNAFVWTYQDPRFRGACIALPRGGSGQRAGLAGIICQSAVSARACFWDSRLRDDANPLREMPAISWPGATLEIKKLKDASNITEQDSGACPDCHRGDNVFLISPDATTWSGILKNSSGTFTTRLEATARAGEPFARYAPITSAVGPGRPEDVWNNVPPTAGSANCASACHSNPSRGFANMPPMPPSCAAGGAGVEGCY